MDRKQITKSYIKYKVKQLLETQEMATIDANRIGKIDAYLKKLPILDKALSILLSPKYRYFVKDMAIISPKPSTYKVILNNDYFIYLTYNGGDITANIEGKTYSLMTLDEAQRASKSVTELLKFSSANITKQETGQGEGDLNSMEGGGFASGGSGGSMDGELPPEGDDNGVPTNDGSEVGGTEDNPDFDVDDILGQK